MALFIGTAGNDNIAGTAGDDLFKLFQGGDDTAFGDAGSDTFRMELAFTAADSIDGGGGFDTVTLSGLSGDDTLDMGATTLLNVERIVLQSGFTQNITAHEDTVAAGETLIVDGSGAGNGLAGFSFYGSLDDDESFDITGSAFGDYLTGGNGKDRIEGGDGNDNLTGRFGNDVLRGGAGDDALGGIAGKDKLTGGTGADFLFCGSGKDTLIFADGGDSSSTAHDLVLSFNADVDRIDVAIAVASVFTDSGTVNAATFDADLASQANDWVGAKVFTVTGGDLMGKVYLLIDMNGSVSYEAGTDLVIDITGFGGTFDTGDFI